MSEWKPIETAPKDGTSVWIWHDDMLCIGCFIPESRYTSGGWRVQAKIRRSDVAERWAYGDVVSLEFAKGHPVKWMPLPTAPSRPSQDGPSSTAYDESGYAKEAST